MSLGVVHVSPYLHPAWAYGHVPRHVFELARAQAGAGHTVTVLTTDAHAPHERLPAGERQADGVRIVRVRNVVGPALTWLGLSTPIGIRRQARRLFAEHRRGIVHLHELRTIENLLLLASIPNDATVIVSTHGASVVERNPAWVRRPLERFVTSRLLARVDHVIVSSAGEADALRALADTQHVRLASDQVSVVPAGVMPTDASSQSSEWPERGEARRIFGLDERSMVVLVPATHQRETGVLMMIQALARMPRVGRVQLLVGAAADSLPPSAQAVLDARDLWNCVRFAGYLDIRRTPDALVASDLLAVPCADGRLRGLVSTAISAAIPVLRGKGSDLSDLVDADAGSAIDDSAEAWAAAIESVSSDDCVLQSMRELARVRAAERGWPTIAATVVDIYERACRRRPAAASDQTSADSG